jgi:hypothetical protein
MTPEEAKAFIGLGGVPLVVGLTEWVKQSIPELDKRFWPTVAMFWAMALNAGLAWVLAASYPLAALSGILTGLAAMKLYDAGPSSRPEDQAGQLPPKG